MVTIMTTHGNSPRLLNKLALLDTRRVFRTRSMLLNVWEDAIIDIRCSMVPYLALNLLRVIRHFNLSPHQSKRCSNYEILLASELC
jgi:hypothetical protein